MDCAGTSLTRACAGELFVRRSRNAFQFQDQREELVRLHEEAHGAYYDSAIFGGPSLYFHQKALLAAESDFPRFADLVYAVLASWGMHRMGRGGSKMREFADFNASMTAVWDIVIALRQATPESMDEAGWRDLRRVFVGIRCMATGTSLVGNSKVLAHALPRLVPPVDREYTMNFLFGSAYIDNDIEREWEILQKILCEFFYPVARDRRLQSKLQHWLQSSHLYPWDTSPLKIVDNLVIGFSKLSGITRSEKSGAQVLR